MQQQTISSDNIDAVARLEQEYLARRGLFQRIGDRIGESVGTIGFVLVHIVWFVFWFVINTNHMPGIRPFDPYPFIFLSMAVSVEAVLLSTFVLMKQNTSSARAEERAQLHLQIALLIERETTAAIRILRAVSHSLHAEESSNEAEVEQLAQVTELDRLMRELRRKMPSEAA